MGHLAATGLQPPRGDRAPHGLSVFLGAAQPPIRPGTLAAMTPTHHFAYRITAELGPETREFIGAGTSLLDATARAAQRLEALSGPEASLIAISRMGPALVPGPLQQASPRLPSRVMVEPPRRRPPGPRRRRRP